MSAASASSEPLVSLRVHRVVPRDTSSLDFLTPEERVTFFTPDAAPAHVDATAEGPSAAQEGETTAEAAELGPEVAAEWQFLPRAYGQVYLGELFSFYVRVINDSPERTVTGIGVRVDLQVTNRVINLCDSRKDSLKPGGAFNQLIQHEVKEMGASV